MSQCKMGALLASMDPADRDAVVAAFDTATQGQIYTALRREGYQLARETLRTHIREICACRFTSR